MDLLHGGHYSICEKLCVLLDSSYSLTGLLWWDPPALLRKINVVVAEETGHLPKPIPISSASSFGNYRFRILVSDFSVAKLP